jgi:hypothetical protein
MTKISKLMLGAGVLGVLGITALPLTSYAADVSLTVTVAQSDSTTGTGGNNAGGYTWKVVDKDKSKLNMSTDASKEGTSSSGVGLAPVATNNAFTTVGTVGEYGLKFTPTAVTSGPTVTVTSGYYIAITGSDQTIGSTAGPGNIQAWPTSLTVAPASDQWGTDTSSGSVVSLTAHWPANFAAGTYYNTITITQTNN